MFILALRDAFCQGYNQTKNDWSCTFTPPYACTTCTGPNSAGLKLNDDSRIAAGAQYTKRPRYGRQRKYDGIWREGTWTNQHMAARTLQ